MNSQRIPWFWPLSFLAALGQFLLLVTDNRGGPAVARIALATWTLWLPGAWLGDLLTKPGTRLAARIPVQASCALGLAALVLLLRTAGVGADTVAIILTATAMAVAFAHLVVPAATGRRRRRVRGSPASGTEAAATGLLLFAGAFLIGFHLWTGAPLSARSDAPDHLAAASWERDGDGLFPPRPFHPDWGTPGYDGERGVGPALVDLVARMADRDAAAVWGLLPAVFAPLLLLALYAMGRALFAGPLWAFAAALLHLALFTRGFSGGELTDAGFPDHMALIPFWTALALFVEGQDRPHLPSVLAFGLAAVAVWALHAPLGFVLFVVMIAIGLRIVTSMERFQEGFPLLVSLWIPWGVFTGLYLMVRRLATGSFDPFGLPAYGLWNVGPGDARTLDPFIAPAAVLFACAVAWLFAVVLIKSARRWAGGFYLVLLTGAAPWFAFTPWLAAPLARWLGAGVHVFPFAVPLGFVLAAELRWGWQGLIESKGTTWLRLATLVATGAAVIVTLWSAFANPFYRPGNMAAVRETTPESWGPLAQAVRDSISGGTVVLAEPEIASFLAARAGVRSALDPSVPWDAAEAEDRWLLAREAVEAPNADPAVWVSEHRAGFLITTAVAAASADSAAADSSALPSPLRHISLGDAGSAYFLTGLGGSGEFGSGEFNPGANRAGGDPGFPWRRDGTGVTNAEAVGITPLRAVPGDTLTLTARWRTPRNFGATDRFGYRMRVELERQRGIRNPGLLARSWRRVRGWFVPDRTVWSVTAPVAAEHPPWWWPTEGFTESVALVLPADLEPGVYAVRAQPHAVATHRDRTRGTLKTLEGEPVATVTVVAR